MAQTFANLLTHIVFSTQDRVSNIRPELRPDFAPSKLLSSHSITSLAVHHSRYLPANSSDGPAFPVRPWAREDV
jgi:hypothetical protein